MSKLLFIDSDDIVSLSEALREALERRGVRFGVCSNVTPAHRSYDEDDDYLFQESGGYSYGGCGGSGNRSASCGYGSCGGHTRYGSCGGGAHC